VPLVYSSRVQTANIRVREIYSQSSTINDDTTPERVDISLPDTTTTVIMLPGERSQSSTHTSTRERRLAIQRISLSCVYRRLAHISYATRIYADGARHPACLPAR
jgi:hypothetical protein